MQNTVLGNFRARLRSRGFSHISIKRLFDDKGNIVPFTYVVSFHEPIFDSVVSGNLTETQMHYLCR